jgi:hypothetical protein
MDVLTRVVIDEPAKEIPSTPYPGHDRLAIRRLAVTWLGGWTRDRLSYLVMVVHVEPCYPTRTIKNGSARQTDVRRVRERMSKQFGAARAKDALVASAE